MLRYNRGPSGKFPEPHSRHRFSVDLLCFSLVQYYMCVCVSFSLFFFPTIFHCVLWMMLLCSLHTFTSAIDFLPILSRSAALSDAFISIDVGIFFLPVFFSIFFYPFHLFGWAACVCVCVCKRAAELRVMLVHVSVIFLIFNFVFLLRCVFVYTPLNRPITAPFRPVCVIFVSWSCTRACSIAAQSVLA